MIYIKWLHEISLGDISTVGGKTASLGEMVQQLSLKGIDIPPGFAISANAYRHFLSSNQIIMEKEAIRNSREMEKEELILVGKNLREKILLAKIPQDLEQEIRFAFQQLKSSIKGVTTVAVRSSATAEDLPEASFAGQQESFLNITTEEDLIKKCVECFASLYTDRAVSYRQDQKIQETSMALTICIQAMVRSDLASSGVMFTIDTESGFKDAIVIDASWGLGENIVKGVVNPDEYLVFKPTLRQSYKPLIGKKMGGKEYKLIYDNQEGSQVKNIPTSNLEKNTYCLAEDEILQLAKWGMIIEEHYSRKNGKLTPMDIEWAKDGVSGKIYILQARPETVQSLKVGHTIEVISLKEKSRTLLKGDSIGDRIGQGKVRIIHGIEDLHHFKQGEILVAEKTEPDWEPFLKRASAIITDRGGRTCHAAIVSRELNIPAVVGTKFATKTLLDGMEVTVACMFGREGFIFEGVLPYEVKIIQIEQTQRPKTKIMMNIAQPEAAFKSAMIPNDGVGLLRMEFIISNTIRIHPMALVHFKSITEEKVKAQIRELTFHTESKKDFFVDELARGISHICAAFYPKDVIVRFSDFKTDEYRSLLGGQDFEDVEDNPMIGFRGASRYFHPAYKEAFELECQAIKKIREEMGFSNLKIMIPFCRTLHEAKKVLEVMAQCGLAKDQSGLEIYMMCEIPSNALLIEEFAEFFDGFSIGSNDLTQLTLGIDRNSEMLASEFSETDPAVLKMISMAIEGAHKKNKKIGLCGQRPSDDADFAKFLVHHHIDSISLDPDAVIRVTQKVREVEQQEDDMKKIRDIMTKNPATCLPDATLEFAAKLMVDHDCGEIPVIDNERDMKPIGVITDRDICKRSIALGKNPLQLKVSDCMTSPAVAAQVDASVEECCKLMEQNKIRRIPIVDHNGRCCGMVSIADLANKVDQSTTVEVVKEVCRPREGRAA